MTLREAANVAWHVRVNGFDGVSRENLLGALTVLEQLAKREALVRALVEQVAADSPEYTTSTLEVTAKYVGDFKIGTSECAT